MSPPWELRRRGLKDSLRHDARVKDAIRKNLRELISEETIITSDGKKTIKIPMRYLDQYHFKYGTPERGVGQGPGQSGDIIGQRNGAGDNPGDGPPGDQPGEHAYEVDVPLEELVQMMLEDLALPWLEEKPERQVITTRERYDSLRRTGPMATLDKKRTLLENLKRHAAQGDPHIGKFDDMDRRHKTSEPFDEHHANAAVYMLMDVSGSMTPAKRYIAKSFFFWMVHFLRTKYQKVETVFIAHDVEAGVVTEQDFFAMSEGGGTRCSSAYEITLKHQGQFHPTQSWNVYVFHFSDGDNLPNDNAVCKSLVEELLPRCAMMGYGEIRYKDDASFYGWTGQMGAALSSLQSKLKEITSPRFLSVAITHKEELFQVLQEFLKPREAAPRTAPLDASAL